MMKLSQEHITFIDRYLENSDVIYADIRMEMVDHVASEIEAEMEAGDQRPFYEIFKDYMISHKRQLMDNKRRVILSLSKKLALEALKNLYSPFFVMTFLLICLGYYGAMQWLEIRTAGLVYLFMSLGLLLIPMLLYEYHRKTKGLPRFSGIERLGVSITALTQLVYLLFNFSSLTNIVDYSIIFSVFFALTMTMGLALTKVGLKQFETYKKRHFKL
jgi:hypothetical protein